MADLIEREKAIDALKAEVRLIDGYCCVDDRVIDESDAIEAINSLPSAQPEQKVGKWIGGELGYCTCCGHKGCASDIWNGCKKLYCPNCGARMMEEQDGKVHY